MRKKDFEKDLIKKFKARLPEKFQLPKNAVGKRILKEYGALFVAGGGAVVPDTVIFKDEEEVSVWQSSVEISRANINGFDIELQTAAMKHLKNAIAEARENNFSISPRGADSARRSYAETLDLWASRVNPALIHWVNEAKLSITKARRIRSITPFEQVAEILKLEEKGIFFSKDLSKSIVYSVAPPGSSQHLSMLALDINEYNNADARQILAKHGWFQTVVSDLPHFTFLGKTENELAASGLKEINDESGRVFWIPNL